MKGYIEERAIEIARYIIDNNTTVRQAAKHFGISKSTVHKDVTERLEKINASLAAETRKVLDVNKYHYQAWKQLADKIGVYFDEQINGRLHGVSRMDSLDKRNVR